MSLIYKIGITGNICSGKSSLVKYMAKKPNCLVLNLDETVHQIYDRNLFIEKILKENFCKGKKGEISQKVYTNADKLFQEFYRKELGKLVFNDEQKINRLNKILKNEVRIKMLSDFAKIEFDLMRQANDNKVNIAKKYFLFVEGAMMMEAGFHIYLDEIWQTRIDLTETEKRFVERLKAQNTVQYDKEILGKILKRQMTPEEKMSLCKHTIDTSNDFEITKQTYDLLYEDLCKKFLV